MKRKDPKTQLQQEVEKLTKENTSLKSEFKKLQRIIIQMQNEQKRLKRKASAADQRISNLAANISRLSRN